MGSSTLTIKGRVFTVVGELARGAFLSGKRGAAYVLSEPNAQGWRALRALNGGGSVFALLRLDANGAIAEVL